MSRYKAVEAYEGTLFQMPALDLDRADQVAIGASNAVQDTAIDSEMVFVFATGAPARVAWGETPVASADAGSVPIAAGMWLPIVKERGDKIAVIGLDATAGTLDIVPAYEIAEE